MKRARATFLLVAMSLAGWASAQAPAPTAQAQAQAQAPSVAPAGQGGIQGQNIFDVKPDASSDPNYSKQTNGERAKVQPGNNAPMWRQVGAGLTGFSSLPKSEAPEAGNLIQPFVQYPGSRLTNAGEAWRQVRNNWLIPYGGSLLIIVALAIGIFYFSKGMIKNHAPDTGRKIERFTPFERAAHWSNAIAFVILAVSGIVMAFGKFFLLPIMGASLFGWLTYALKNMHNFAGPLFAVSLVIVFLTFLRDNWPQKGDLTWLRKGGGLVSGSEPASYRFNAGEKVVFWGGVFFLGLVVVSSGFVLDKLLPGLVYERSTMQIAHMVHAVATVLMMAMFIGHIYLGTIGMQGAYQGMKTGYVDETWAREHHEYWYDDVKAGKIPAQRSATAVSGQTLQA
ncbi:MAG: formate dehydrogenase subunit gamma [Polaromonas sp. 39-63-203]|uniref:formate dehydrogenase subunit gamma n=1 Tax=Polaromonas sp. TaxID=1869339 RepID=UPI000BCCED14|nr:formate dehydrogenase subunit gamma [Polaromonas sp.]OYY52301.1 MAG: formate dehydrogenase subunit gamma [Polaromonas sp. 35-63-240]OYY97311.1 MAG: formate dehydrogenase subunit gamma [Polaromonas sp. 28-63-22]OYZ83706.1 MAG: formate dehydrogenase subunit gamma [Polaromonas sp. 24-62-144]OZA97977.1 MAG: formate dehydrogenase subunit gamma [Polaromonas sp. 39-63-203]HQS32268.1 formate dehydrogenase subunit gamma [Polaromonas sp.]